MGLLSVPENGIYVTPVLTEEPERKACHVAPPPPPPSVIIAFFKLLGIQLAVKAPEEAGVWGI